MKQILIALSMAVLASASGCKKNDVVSKLETYKTEMCKCTDRACVDKLNKEAAAWMESMGEPANMSESDLKAITKLTEEIDACEAKAKAADKK
jgi:hypothetical protein